MIKHKFKNKKINYAILRYFNVAGASESGKVGQISSGDQLFKNLSLASKKQKPTISVYGGDYNTYDGTCIRDYIHVSDISKIHLLVLNKIKKNKRSIVLNCGYGKGISVLEGIRAFQKETKKKFVIRYKPRRKGDMEEIKADNSRIKKFLNWKPKSHKLKKIVKTCIKWENSKQY